MNKAVFVWYHVEGEEPWTLPAVPEVDTGKWVYNGKSEFVINGRIQQIPENAADVAHLNCIHSPNMFTGSDIRYTRSFLSSFAMHAWNLRFELSAKLRFSTIITCWPVHIDMSPVWLRIEDILPI